jgi:lysophospholipase L1-like esterase
MLKEIGRKLDVPVLDLHPVFLANRDRALYTDGLHLTSTGHDLVASHLREFVR